MKLKLITLISNPDTPLLVSSDELKDLNETKAQFSGMIRSTAEEDNGFRKTRVNKSKLNKIRVCSNDYLSIELEAWCLEEDETAVLFNMQEKMKEIMAIQEEQVNQYNELTICRKVELGL